MPIDQSPEQLNSLLRELCRLTKETEWVEFKHDNDDAPMIGEYISVLSNSAALLGKQLGGFNVVYALRSALQPRLLPSLDLPGQRLLCKVVRVNPNCCLCLSQGSRPAFSPHLLSVRDNSHNGLFVFP